MDKSTLILIINGLVGMVLALFAFIGNQALGEIKMLRQRMHDALNHIAAIEAVMKLRLAELPAGFAQLLGLPEPGKPWRM